MDDIAEATACALRAGGAFLVYQFSPKVLDFIKPHFDHIKGEIETGQRAARDLVLGLSERRHQRAFDSRGSSGGA